MFVRVERTFFLSQRCKSKFERSPAPVEASHGCRYRPYFFFACRFRFRAVHLKYNCTGLFEGPIVLNLILTSDKVENKNLLICRLFAHICSVDLAIVKNVLSH
jgi:hypothetical protein